MRLIAVTGSRRRPVVAHRNRQKVVLQVGMENARLAADKAARLEMVRAAEALAGQDPFDADLQLGERVRRAVKRDRLLAGILHVSLDVVLQVLTDARQVLDDGDAERLERVGVADPRQHEHLWGVDRAALKITSRLTRAVATRPPLRYSTPT